MAIISKVSKGRIQAKAIDYDRFMVKYECSCGEVILFTRETKATCPACETIYECRVMVGRPKVGK